MFRGLFRVLIVAGLLAFSISAANGDQPNITIKEGKNSFTIKTQKSSFSFDISASLIESFEVFTVPNPYRLVIDVSGLDFKKSSTIPIKGCDITSLLRVGIHPDKVRFVFDINEGQEIEFNATSAVSSGNVEVTSKKSTITKSVENPTVSPPTPTLSPTTLGKLTPTSFPTLTLTYTTTPLPSPSPSPILSPTIIILRAPTSVPTPEATATPEDTPIQVTPTQEPEIEATIAPPSPNMSPLPEGQVLKGISFEREADGKVPFIRISLTEEPKFKLVRSNPKLYRITIPDAKPSGTHLFLPSFPPQDFIGLVSVQASPGSDGTVVFIGVERNERINAYREGTDILVKVSPHAG